MNIANLNSNNANLPQEDAVVYIDGIVDVSLPNAPGRVYHVAANDGGTRLIAPSGGRIKLGAVECNTIRTTESETLITLVCMLNGVWTAENTNTWEPAW